MIERQVRPLFSEDWMPKTIETGSYFNKEPLEGFQRRDGLCGNPLHPASVGDAFESDLRATMQRLRDSWPSAILERCHVTMPVWGGQMLPVAEDYVLVNGPDRLTTTSVTVVLVPNSPRLEANAGFCFDGHNLPTFRGQMEGDQFQGLAGNLGYYMTRALIEGKPWAHNRRYPDFPLDHVPSYIGFHLARDETTGKVSGSFQGAHPGVVGIRQDGTVEILPELKIDGYRVEFEGLESVLFDITEINKADPEAEAAVFTPGFSELPEIQKHVGAAEASAGQDKGWQTYSPMIPMGANHGKVNIFVANEGNGRMPVEKVRALWPGQSPVPSFGAVLSFRKDRFESLFGSYERFLQEYADARVRITPLDSDVGLDAFGQMLGGLVPVVADGEHTMWDATRIDEVMVELSRYGATSPLAQCGRETQNFSPTIREPAGVLLQTDSRIGWVLFDGRHELSIGASVVDVARILKTLEQEGVFGGVVQQAVFVDGGSAMKVYYVQRTGPSLSLDLLNRVAAGSRNGPGADPEGLNLYSLLKLSNGASGKGEL